LNITEDEIRLKNKNEIQEDRRTTMQLEKLKIRTTFGGCPKRKVCGIHQADAGTCTYGPYSYCGKYRSIINPEKPNTTPLSNDA
jgi:hypothetical protein